MMIAYTNGIPIVMISMYGRYSNISIGLNITTVSDDNLIY